MTTTMKNSVVSSGRKSVVRSGLNFYNIANKPIAKSYIHNSSEQTRLLRLRTFVKNGKLE